MSKELLYYSVCQYIPDEVRAESINVGMVFHMPYTKNTFSEFRSIKSLNRVKTFDDELDQDYINLMFENLHYQFDFKLDLDIDEYKELEFEDINNENYLSKKIKFYVNEFQFLPVQKLIIDVDDAATIIEDLLRTYLYYDTPKNKRITRNEVKILLNKTIAQQKLKKYIENEDMLFDFNNDPIFDYQYNNTYVRTFSFDYARDKQRVQELKLFLFDINSISDQLLNKNIYIIINNNIDEEDDVVVYYKELVQKILDPNLNIQFIKLSKYAEQLIKYGLELSSGK